MLKAWHRNLNPSHLITANIILHKIRRQMKAPLTKTKLPWPSAPMDLVRSLTRDTWLTLKDPAIELNDKAAKQNSLAQCTLKVCMFYVHWKDRCVHLGGKKLVDFLIRQFLWKVASGEARVHVHCTMPARNKMKPIRFRKMCSRRS